MPEDAWAEVECPKCGRDSCAADCTPASPGLRFRSAPQLIADPRPVEIIEGIAWAGATTVLVSESGAGKTFYLLGAEAAVADGRPCYGRAVQCGSVAHVAYEGDALGLRLQALQEAGFSLANLHVLRASDPLSPRVVRDGVEGFSPGEASLSEALAALATDLVQSQKPPIVLVTIDTVRASLSGSEDSSEHVSAYLRAVRRIMAPFPGAACLLAHHAGWMDGEQKRKRERGSSAFRGNVEATLYLEVVEDDPENHLAYLELRALKVRDAERPAPLRLVRRRVELLAADPHGQPVTSCVIERDGRSREDRDRAEVEAIQAADRETDIKVLKAMRDYPAATNQKKLRAYVGLAMGDVAESIGRILRAGWAIEGGRGEPFKVTSEGLAVLGEQQ